jgi:hypothetical protein
LPEKSQSVPCPDAPDSFNKKLQEDFKEVISENMTIVYVSSTGKDHAGFIRILLYGISFA